MKRGIRIAGLALAGAILAGLVFHAPLLTALGSYLDQSSPPQKADAVFVLAGDFAGDRILKAGELVREGYAPKALVSGPAGLYGRYESELAISFAENAGYPSSYFVAFPNHAKSTREEAAAAVQQLRAWGAHRVLLVTNNFHCRRAGQAFRREAPDLAFTMVEAPNPYFSVNGWWRNREGRKIFLIEWLKTVAYWVGM